MLELRHFVAALGGRRTWAVLLMGAMTVSVGVQTCTGSDAADAAQKSIRALPPIPAIDLSAWPEAVRREGASAQERAKRSPDDPAAVGDLGMRYFAYDFPAAGAVCFERACALAPESFKWHYYRGLAWRKAGESAKAVEALEKATQLDPRYAAVFVALGDLLQESDPARARALYETARSLDAKDPAADLGLGHLARRAGDRDSAEAHYRRALETYPNYAEAHYGLAMVLSAAGKREEAQGHLRAHKDGGSPPLTNDPLRVALMKLKQNAPLLRDQAERLYREGDTQGAEALLHQSIQSDESGTTSHIKLGVLLARQGKLEEAAAQFREALAADPINIEARSSLGLALAGLHRDDEAERLYREVLAQNPSHAPTLAYLGQLLSLQGKADDAIGYLRRAVEAQPANGLYQYSLGDLLARKGNDAEAATHLGKAAGLLPRSAPVRFALGGALLRAGDRRGAQAAWKDAVRLDPKLADAHEALAEAALEDHDAAAAIEWAEKACEQTSYANPMFVETLARAYEAVGRKAEAAAVRQRAGTPR